MKRIINQQIARFAEITDTAKKIGLWLGPLLFILIYFFLKPEGMPQPAIAVTAVTVWIAVWWVTEAMPLPATSLLPIILFPLLGILDTKQTAGSYGNEIVFLYIGGFLIAIAIEKTGLHQRVALNIIKGMGTRLNMIILGFMLSTGFISMWISNTATAIMMLPIGLAIISSTSVEDPAHHASFKKALMLAIAYAATIGGLATLIGTPPNLVFAGAMRDMYKTEISFMKWFVIGFPITVLLIIISWWYLTRISFPMGKARLSKGADVIRDKLTSTGATTKGERIVAIVFLCVAISWVVRSFLPKEFIPGLDDTIIALTGGIVLFFLPDGKNENKRMITWEDTTKLPWGIVLLFGGGFALAKAFEVSGLAVWIGENMSGLAIFGVFVMIIMVVMIVNFLTEFTSNVATVTMILPVLKPIADASGVHPFYLMVGATLAASCGFMMPAGTPPNAIAFGSGYISIWDMVKNGFWLNLVSIAIITLVIYFLLGPLWGI